MSFINPCKNCLIISMCEKSCEKLDKATNFSMAILKFFDKFSMVFVIGALVYFLILE